MKIFRTLSLLILWQNGLCQINIPNTDSLIKFLSGSEWVLTKKYSITPGQVTTFNGIDRLVFDRYLASDNSILLNYYSNNVKDRFSIKFIDKISLSNTFYWGFFSQQLIDKQVINFSDRFYKIAKDTIDFGPLNFSPYCGSCLISQYVRKPFSGLLQEINTITGTVSGFTNTSDLLEKLEGDWDWINSSGGFNGSVISPSITGNNLKLLIDIWTEFNGTYSYRLLRNDTLISNGFNYTKIDSAFSPGKYWNIGNIEKFGNRLKAELLDDKTLRLTPMSCTDCFQHIFTHSGYNFDYVTQLFTYTFAGIVTIPGVIYTTNTRVSNSKITFSTPSIPGITYQWDFGDGNTATGNIVTHIFNKKSINSINSWCATTHDYPTSNIWCKDNYKVCLTGKSNGETTFKKCQVLKEITYQDTSHIFTLWGQSPTNTYTFNYSVSGTNTVTESGILNMPGRSYFNINTKQNPIVTFSLTPLSGVSYTWDFGDGETLTGHNVQHTYNKKSINSIFNNCIATADDPTSVTICTDDYIVCVTGKLNNAPIFTQCQNLLEINYLTETNNYSLLDNVLNASHNHVGLIQNEDSYELNANLSNFEVTVYTSSGSLVFTNEGQGRVIIPKKALTKGLNILKIKSKEGVYIFKVVNSYLFKF